MPYRRKYRRPYRKRKPKYGYFGKAGSDATKAMRMAGKALALLNVEEHVVDNNISIANQTTAATIGNLFSITQGDGIANRQGNSIKATQIHGRFTVYKNASASESSIRIIVGIDHQSNGVLPAVTDVLAVGDVHAMRNTDYGKRFTILMDKRSYLTAAKAIWQPEFHKQLSMHCEFKSNLGGIQDFSTNSFFIIVVSDEVTNGPQVEKYVRLRYLDN